MALKSIQSNPGYDNLANTANSANSMDISRIHPKQQQISHVNVSSTSVTNSVKPVFAQSGKNQSQNEDSGKHTQATESQIRAAISEANFKATRTRCEFSVDDKTQRISIKVIDKESAEVIREIPAEESLEMLAKIWELAGILVDEKR